MHCVIKFCNFLWMLHRHKKSRFVSKYKYEKQKNQKIINSYSTQDFVKIEMTPPQKEN